MKRRHVLLLAALTIMIAFGALTAQKKKEGTHPVLDRAARSTLDTPPAAVLVELGLKDTTPTPWPGRVTVTGARVVHREGYRFRDGDKLTAPDAWEASSHRPIRLPPRQPALARTEGIATVGIVLHLADVKDNAELTVERTGTEKTKVRVPLKQVLAGKPAEVFDGGGVVRLVSTAVPLATGKTEDDFPAACYDKSGILWVAWVGYRVRDEARRIEQQQLKEQPKDFKAYYTPEFADQLFVQYHLNGKWSKPFPVTDDKQDIVRCAVASDANGVWVVYSANRGGNYDLYARKLDLNTPEAVSHPKPNMSQEERLTTNPGPDLSPVLCTGADGHVYGSFQSWAEGRGATTGHWLTCVSGKWNVQQMRGGGPLTFNEWHPAVAAGPQNVAVAHDSYTHADYDVSAVEWGPEGDLGRPFEHGTPLFEARPSVAYDAQGRLWLAYEEGPELWGKDYGALDADDGNPLYSSRSVRVVCLSGGKAFRPVAELPTSNVAKPKLPFAGQVGPTYERSVRYAYPQIGIDGKGRVWLTYRQKFGTRYSTHPGSYWLTFARRLDGDRWSEPIEVHHSDGLLDHRPVLLPHKSGGLLIVHNTDGRYTTPEKIDNDIYLSYVNLPGDPVEPKLVPFQPAAKDLVLSDRARKEREAVQRMRDYRVVAGGKQYRLLRGEFHRHTEISWDGGPDGSLEDMFRYGLDAAGMDWIGNGDHDNGAGREYAWWLVQKFTDAYHVRGSFTPMFTYERSVAYPHGHRNCMFDRRGVRTLPRLAEPDESKRVGAVHADDTKMLYRYLKEMGGLCAVHTSATSMGTDWRDNDPQVEPIVEIYQGDRMSYEHEEAPRAGYDPQSKKEPANIAGWYPKGFINHALQKGYRLGFQASSDHWSTHISYCVVLAEKHDRSSILDALKKRHVYGATDEIVVDLRSGQHVQGDEFKTTAPPVLEMTVIGTAPIARIDILKDSKVVDTIKPGKAEYRGTWTDPKPTTGVHYYYIRVLQADNELAWASPLWIDYQK